MTVRGASNLGCLLLLLLILVGMLWVLFFSVASSHEANGWDRRGLIVAPKQKS